MTHDFPKMLLYFKDPIDKDKKKKIFDFSNITL